MATSEEELLQAEFLLYPKKNKINVKLTKTVILINPCGNSTKSESINVSDVIGCHVLEGNEATAARWYLCVFSYPLKKKVFKGLCRQRISKSFGVACCDSEDQNKVLAEKWKRVIQHLARGKVISKSQVNDLPEIALRHFVVFINPFSGQGKSIQIYRNHVKPMFAEADITCKTIETERSNHAHGMVKQMDFNQYDGIIIVSGDGLVHEIINGLMEREDWEKAIKTPIGIVASGSGNALAASIVYASTGQSASLNLVRDSIFEIVRGRTTELSLVYAESQKRGGYYSFLNFGWGFVADVDIESEKYRALGKFRFTVGCAVRILSLRKYRGMLSYLPLKDQAVVALGSKQAEDTLSNSEDGASSQHVTGILTPSSSQVENCPPSPSSADTHQQLTSSSEERDITSAAPNSHDRLCAPFHLKTAVSEPLPEEWKSIEGEFIWITPVYLSHMGEDMFMMPRAGLAEEVIYLYCLTAELTKTELTNILLSIENGSHLAKSPDKTYVIPCRGFRLKPLSTLSGLMTVDGEKIDYEPIQASVTPVKVPVMCSAPKP